ncbi:MAG TPA: hypothetical protein VGQ62_21400 [Chloroflexota bacterium]|nr:hypothetical protein [Chloroflexota bacterium]
MVSHLGLVAAVLLAALLSAPAANVGAAPVDNAAQSIAALRSAINTADAEAAIGLFTADAVVIQPRFGGLPQLYAGREQLRYWLGGLINQHVGLADTTAIVFLDDRLRWPALLTLDSLRDVGLDAVEVESEVVLADDDRISSLTMTYTPTAARRLLASGG